MKKLICLFLLLMLLGGCGRQESEPIVASTAPVQQFAQAVCEGTGLEVGLIVSDSVACLHDYTLSVRQMVALEKAQTVIITGGGLEAFMEDALASKDRVIACADGAELLCTEHEHDHAHEHEHDHAHETYDPHIWLDPDNAAVMVRNIALQLGEVYPQHAAQFAENAEACCASLAVLKEEGLAALEDISCRGLITFHDGFAYFAHAFDLEILAAIEEEAGSEASAKDLKAMVELVREAGVPAVFVEQDGSHSAAAIISDETGCRIGVLDTALSGTDYFAAMEANILAVKEVMQ